MKENAKMSLYLDSTKLLPWLDKEICRWEQGRLDIPVWDSRARVEGMLTAYKRIKQMIEEGHWRYEVGCE